MAEAELRNMPPDDERRAIANDLWLYGEEELAARALELTDADLARIAAIAFDHATTSDNPSGAGMLFSQAITLAAVEVLEGERRTLTRQRRRPLGSSPYRGSGEAS